MSDAFLTLAQCGDEGLSCFIVPRWIPNSNPPQRNSGLIFNRLKSKIGDRANASSEVEYRDAWAEMLGPKGRGIQTILTMVHHTRLDCIVMSAGLMRRCVLEALHHTHHRKTFGKRLQDSLIMKNVLADLVIESEAATALAFRVAETFDAQPNDEGEALLGRIATPLAKYFVCKRAPQLAYEAMECLGGNGYIEDGIMARLFRQAPLNAIWEGSGPCAPTLVHPFVEAIASFYCVYGALKQTSITGVLVVSVGFSMTVVSIRMSTACLWHQ
eukprot:m.477521 g.477521  ORF g.477521 m.477521 type:complete len:271 (-) comp21688_c1_seq9:15-827(-)